MDYSLAADKGIKDMIDIDELNHATILYNLFRRYEQDDIYTYVGPTLLAVNPFKDMGAKYPATLIEDYKAIIEADDNSYYDVMKSKAPHTYAISAFAHRQMRSGATATRQAIVISGESGAGKTESARQCMAFLTTLGGREKNDGKKPIGERILSTNPVLEAFGNARTARNDNSSRFGKYVKLYFELEGGSVQGAEIKNYLLEKSRVVGCTEKERNYHIFFFMMRGIRDV
jgi:myosin-5